MFRWQTVVPWLWRTDYTAAWPVLTGMSSSPGGRGPVEHQVYQMMACAYRTVEQLLASVGCAMASWSTAF